MTKRSLTRKEDATTPCSQAGCVSAATCLPAFLIPFQDGAAPRRIVVPFEVCARHAMLIGTSLTSARRQAMLARSCGAAAARIDWSRCRLELVPTTRAPLAAAVTPAA